MSKRLPRAPTGHPLGQAHHNAKHSDAVVAQARALRAQGHSYAHIGHELGVPWRTVCDWVNWTTRYA